jgi:aminopeptidase N
MFSYRHLFPTLILIALFSAAIPAQFAKPDMNRPRSYDVQHYIIGVSFDRAKKTVFGDTTIRFKPLKSPMAIAEFDAVNLSFESVKLEPGDKDLKYRTSGGKVTVTLDRTYSSDETVAVRFKYSTVSPKKGIYFVDATSGPESAPYQIWTQGEAQEARYWFPSFDDPGDKATSEEYITAEKGQSVIGNGELVGQTDNSDNTTTFHYQMPVPYSTYLTSFVIGTYVKKTDSHDSIPLGFYVYPGKEQIVPVAFSRTKDMMQAFENVTGVKFPFNKYDQVIIRNFNFGGMENITATTLADTEVFFANFDFGKAVVQDLVSHELSHSWFGDMVTCRNWSELYLNEGFATFMEAVAREKLYGRDSYLRKVRSDAEQFMADDTVNKRRHGLFNRLADPSNDSLFDTTTYQKGGTVIHMLRETIGDDAFWKGINIYLTRHRFDNVETADLRKAMEEASGKKLDWFFEQWIYGAGYPKLDIRQQFSPGTKTLKLTVSQVQRLDNITPHAFTLPLELEITTAGGVKQETINITKRVDSFTIKLDGKPTGLKIDKDEKIPLKTVRVTPAIGQ